jgi:hypothetical protein
MAKKRFRFRPPRPQADDEDRHAGAVPRRLGLAWVIAPVVAGAMILIAGYLVLAR